MSPSLGSHHKDALSLLQALAGNANLTISSLHSSAQQKAKYKSHRLGGENRFSSFITARCQAGFQFNFSCALTQALLFPEISPGSSTHSCALLPLPDTPAPAPALLSALLQGAQSHTAGTRSSELPNPSLTSIKPVLTSSLY